MSISSASYRRKTWREIDIPRVTPQDAFPVNLFGPVQSHFRRVVDRSDGYGFFLLLDCERLPFSPNLISRGDVAAVDLLPASSSTARGLQGHIRRFKCSSATMMSRSLCGCSFHTSRRTSIHRIATDIGEGRLPLRVVGSLETRSTCFHSLFVLRVQVETTHT